ncbi:MAG: hypothetical protein LC776_05130 [Acidobacteria bacterium]|nr:hypothetical protein [Acidobacteriota bacterium]
MSGTLRNLTPGAVLVLFLAATGSAFAQQVKDRQLIPALDFANIQMPVEILSVKLNGRDIQPGEKLRAGEDWLRGLSFTLKNVSDKPIAFVRITLQFSYPEDSARPGRIVGYFLSYGLDITSERPSHWKNAPGAIQPGKAVNLVLSNEKYPVFLNILAQGGMTPDVSTAKYYVASVAFENEPDIVWRGGNLMRRDPNDPNKFNVVERYTVPSRRE